jgi:rhodanese-related sulfurtransferase
VNGEQTEEHKKMMITGKRLIRFFVFTLALVSNSYAGPDFKTIDTLQLHSMIVDNAYRIEGGREMHFTVIETRTKEEYDEAHIFSAISIPEKDFDKLIYLLPKDKAMLLVVYCNDSEIETIKKWADKAVDAGYINITIYSEGFHVWKTNEMPIAPLTNHR